MRIKKVSNSIHFAVVESVFDVQLEIVRGNAVLAF